MTSLVSPLLGENSLFADIGKIFHPLFEFFGLIVSGIYSVTGNYGLSIIGLTVLIMLALTPVTVKSTKSMIAMQRLQPEMKKLQTKYKGPENRELLNQEMMKLYKENGTSPFGACLPSLLQMPFLIVLYSLIRGLSNTVKNGATYVNGMGHTVVCHTTNINGCAAPRYIPTDGKMYHNLVLNHGQMHWWFGMDLSSTPFTTHTFPGSASQAVLMIPYLVLIGAAIFLQYYQMKQMNSRNPGAAQANPQMQTMQKFFPIIFGVIYLRVPAGATLYMVFSSAMRIGTQEVMFRTGMVSPVGAEREIGGGAKGAKGTQEALPEETGPKPNPTGKGGAKPAGKSTTAPKNPGGTNGTNGNGRRPTTGKRPASGKGSSGRRVNTNGRAVANGSADDATTPAPKPHPRSRSKKERKAR
jgi:YidC/Oxa1 family membrane protein insertase